MRALIGYGLLEARLIVTVDSIKIFQVHAFDEVVSDETISPQVPRLREQV